MKLLLLPVLLVLMLVIGVVATGCIGDPWDDLYTSNLYPGTTDTYDVGSAALRYDSGYFREIWLNGALLVPGIIVEVDPVFTGSPAFGITALDILAWSGHPALTTGTHGVGAGNIVGTTLIQELTNKTLTASEGKGTWTASGTWKLPAMYFNGDITTDRWLSQPSNTFLGVDVAGTGNLAHTGGSEGYSNTGIGNAALRDITTGYFNAAVGTLSLASNTTGYFNSAFGTGVLLNTKDGYFNTGVGLEALATNISGDRNTAVGMFAGYSAIGDDNVFIGFKAGEDEVGSNKLYIDNTDTASPLIYGDFSTNALTINGTLSMATHQINNVVDPTLPQDAATMNYVDTHPAGSSATVAITDDNATNAAMYPTWVTTNAGNLPVKVSSTKLSFNPNLGTLTLANGNLSFSVASDITSPANTAASLEITDSTNKLLAFDTRTGTDNITSATFSAAPVTIANVAGTTYSQVGVAAKITTLSTNTGVTALNGLQLSLSAPTINQSGGAVTVSTASTLNVAAPVAGAGVTITNSNAINSAGDIYMGANKLKTTNLLLKEGSASTIYIRNLADNAYMNLRLDYLDFGGDLRATAASCNLRMQDADNASFTFMARDNTVGNVQVMKMVGAVDPYMLIGRSDTGVSTNTVTDQFYLQAGTGANNIAASFGLGLPIYLSSDLHVLAERAHLNWVVTNPTAATYATRLDMGLMAGGALTTPLELYGSGGLMMPQAVTEPASTADRAGVYAIDLSANNCTIGFDTETAVIAAVGIASTHKIPVRWNGVTYYLLVTDVP